MRVPPEHQPRRRGTLQADGAPPGLFRAIARRYDLLNRLISFGQDQRWRRKAAAACATAAHLGVLDVATGTADQLVQLRRVAPHGTRLVGVDTDKDMLRHAAQKLTNLPRKRHAFLCRADALHLPFRNATFGAVTMAFAIRNFDNRLEALREARRVLVPGGVLVVLEAGVPETRLARLLFTIYCRYVMPTVAGALSGQRSAYCYLCESIFRFPPPRQFGRLLSEAGLELLRVHSLSSGAAKVFVASTERGESPPEAKISP